MGELFTKVITPACCLFNIIIRNQLNVSFSKLHIHDEGFQTLTKQWPNQKYQMTSFLQSVLYLMVTRMSFSIYGKVHIFLRRVVHLTSVCITFPSCELDEGQTHACVCLFCCFLHVTIVLNFFHIFPFCIFSHSNVLTNQRTCSNVIHSFGHLVQHSVAHYCNIRRKQEACLLKALKLRLLHRSVWLRSAV